MSGRPPRRLRAFTFHLVGAGAAFAFVALMVAGFAMLLRWALPLEIASSSPQRALAASREILALHDSFWVAAGVSLLAVCVAAAWLGRHITGPLTRFTAAFSEIAEGKTPGPVQVRSTDYVAEEVESFNTMLAALRGRARERGHAADELLGTLDELGELARARGDEPALAALARASDLAKRLGGDGRERARG